MPPDSFPPTPRGKDRRATLLRAAETVFSDKGYAQATIADITRMAQTAQVTFYIYFDSKAHIFTELVADLGNSLRREVAKASASASSRLEAERAGIAAFLSLVRDRPAHFTIIDDAKLTNPTAYRAFYDDFAE